MGGANYVPTDGLIGWWSLDEDLGNAIGSVDLLSTALTFGTDRFGENQGAFRLAGSNNLKTDDVVLNSANDHSISIWFRSDDNNGSAQNFYNTSGFNSCGLEHTISSFALNPIGFSSSPAPPFLGFCLGTGQALWTITCQEEAYSIVLESEWNLFTLTKNNLNWTGYINGLQCFSYTANTNVLDAETHLNFGNISACGTNEFFRGYFDDIGIWQRALSSQEVLAFYQSGAPSPQSP